MKKYIHLFLAALFAAFVFSAPAQASTAIQAAGRVVNLSVTADGSAPFSYQWMKNGVLISGATSSTYNIASFGANDVGSYNVSVTNAAGNTLSDTASLTLMAGAGNATATASAASVVVGKPVTFSVSVGTGNPPFTYQWQKLPIGSLAPVSIVGATSATYSLAAAAISDAGSYSAVITNLAGKVTSTAATLAVTSPVVAPTISTQPLSQTLAFGKDASFSVVATGTGPFTYQWQKDGANWQFPNASATTANFINPSVDATDAGTYTCIVTNAAGSVTSTGAVLVVANPPGNAVVSVSTP